ncbi:MAG: hypothetical protein KGO51_14575, partial [Alphaproteobacteria bacterium]|nr:hypothetical protein [Alphaproteobacteria bacterium]
MRLLIYEPSFRRLEAAISRLGGRVEPILMGDDGSLRLGGAPTTLEDARAEAAWANNETFFGPAAR